MKKYQSIVQILIITQPSPELAEVTMIVLHCVFDLFITVGKWRIVARTNKHQSAGTQAQVTIVAYGHKGNSGPIALGNGDGKNFKPGATDIFEVNYTNVN